MTKSLGVFLEIYGKFGASNIHTIKTLPQLTCLCDSRSKEFGMSMENKLSFHSQTYNLQVKVSVHWKAMGGNMNYDALFSGIIHNFGSQSCSLGDFRMNKNKCIM